MPGFDLSGNFTRAMNWKQDRDNGIRILADRHDVEDDNFAGAFNQTFLRNGAVPMTGDLNMGGKRINTIAAGTELLPGLAFELNIATGFYQLSPNALGVTINGAKKMEVNTNGAIIQGSAQPLAIKAGANDHVYIGLYPRTADPALMGGWIGFGSGVATPHLAITNSIAAGAVSITTKTVDGGAVELSPRGALVASVTGAGGVAITPPGAGTITAYSFASSINQGFAAKVTTTTGVITFESNAGVASTDFKSLYGPEGSYRFYPGALATSIFEISKTGISNNHDTISKMSWNVGGTLRYLMQANNVGVYLDADAHTFRKLGGVVNYMTVGIAGIATVDIGGATPDPGVTPAVLAVRCGGVGGGAFVPQYLIRADGSAGSYNNTTHMYAVWAHAKQNVGGASTAIYGEVPVGGGAISRGVHGKMTYLGNAAYAAATAAGVYGECVDDGSAGANAVSYAGCFQNKGTKGNYCIGVYGATLPGAAISQPLRADYNGANMFFVDVNGVSCLTVATAAAANISQVSTGTSLLRSTSALRYKRDVEAIAPINAHKLRSIKPVQFKSKCEADDPDTVFYGFIAEDVAKAGLDPLVHYAYQEDQFNTVPDKVFSTEEIPAFKNVLKKGAKKRPDGVQYERVVVLQQLLINELYERLDALEAKVK